MNTSKDLTNWERLTVVVPAYNKEHEVAQALGGIIEAVPGCFIIVVDDGSTDSTLAQIKTVTYEKLKIFSLPKNSGKGAALLYGVSNSSTEFVGFMDADLDIEASALRNGTRLLIDNPELSCALGSKLHPESSVSYIWHRKLFSLAFRGFLRILFGRNLGDTQTGVKVFRKKALDSVAPSTQSKGWTFELELILDLVTQGRQIAEIPVSLSYSFDTTVSIAQGMTALKEVMLVRVSRRRIKKRAGDPY
jgi:glycosyltransferase involved in cell wall biosynthesis